MLDLFVSYRHSDAENVKTLVSACKQAGLEVWFDEQRIETFASIQSTIEMGLAQSKALLVWYSLAYPESRACQWELTAALIAAQREGDVRRRILIVNPADNNKHINPVELRDAKYAMAPGDAASFDALAATVKQHCATLETPLGASGTGARSPWFGSASGFGSSRFVGRIRELWEIHSGLHSAASPVITDRVARPLVWITGMGGSGKSVLVEEYALRFSAAYPAGVVWLRAFGHDDTRPNTSTDERAQDRERQLAAIAESAGIPVKGINASEIRIKLAEKLDMAGKYLWVVDDLPSDISWEETLYWLAPSANGHTLVSTRRRHESGQGIQVRVEELDEEDAYVLLTTRRPPEGDDQQLVARHIVKALGLNPLGIELAAAAIAQVGYAEFAEQLEETADDELEFAASLLSTAGESLPHREGGNLYLSRTLLASTRGLSEQGFDLLRLAAQVAVAPISRSVISHTFAAADGADELQTRRRADLAIVELISRSLGRAAAAGGIEIHSLVSRVVRFHHSAPEKMRKLRGAALTAFFEEFLVLRDDRTHPELANDALHARRLIEACRISPDAEQAPAHVKLLGVLGRFELTLGRYANSRELYEEAIELSRRVNGEDHHLTLAMISTFGVVLTSLGDFAEARVLLEQALETAKETYGDDSVVTLGLKENLASLLQSIGDHQAAISMLRELIETQSRTPDADVTHVLLTLNNLANALLSAGNAEEAEPVIRMVVAGRTKALGADHRYTLMSLNTLAGALHNQGKIDEAIEILQTVVEGMTRVLGATHAETLQVRSNLASLIGKQGDVDAAVHAQRELLEIYRTSFGPTFPETMRATFNLAESLSSVSQFDEAEALLKRAIVESQQSNGEKHVSTQLAYENLAFLKESEQDWESARALFTLVVKTRIETYGETHPETLIPMKRLANVCTRLKDYNAARSLLEHVVNARVETLGETHPDTRAAMYNLGSALVDLGELSASAAMFERVYNADSAALGSEHDTTLRSLEQWAMSTFEATDYERAATLWGELAAIRERKFGASDMSTLSALDTQAKSFERNGDTASARRIRERLVEISREAYGVVSPATALSIKNLVALLQEIGDNEAARKILEEFTVAVRAAGVQFPSG